MVFLKRFKPKDRLDVRKDGQTIWRMEDHQANRWTMYVTLQNQEDKASSNAILLEKKGLLSRAVGQDSNDLGRGMLKYKLFNP